jgi:plasmid stabilization system protein ParE
MDYRFHPKARQEMEKSVRYYTNIRQQLGQNFRGQIEEVISRILIHPEAWHPLHGNYRRCQIKQFPYAIIYRIDEKNKFCSIYALMHLHQRPGYWRNRKF